MKKKFQGQRSNGDRLAGPREPYQAAIAGAGAGATVGPLRMVAGAVIGAAVGALAGAALDTDSAELSRRDRT
jgi:hypothetical protein